MHLVRLDRIANNTHQRSLPRLHAPRTITYAMYNTAYGSQYVQFGCGMCAPATWLNFDAGPAFWLQSRLPFLTPLLVKQVFRLIPKTSSTATSSKASLCRPIRRSRLLLSRARTHDPRRVSRRHPQRLHLPSSRWHLSHRPALTSNSSSTSTPTIPPPLPARASCRTACSANPPSPARPAIPSHRRLRSSPSSLDVGLQRNRRTGLTDAGFTDIRRAQMGDSPDPRFKEVESNDRWKDCLGVDCKRALNHLHLQKILNQLLPIRRQHTLGMKLHAFNRQLAMPQRHNRLSIPRISPTARADTSNSSGNPSSATISEWYRVQVIADGKPLKIVFPSCSTSLVLPCISFCSAHHVPAKRRANRLMPQANPQNRHPPLRLRKMLNQLNRDPRILRRTRPRRDHNPLRPQRLHLSRRQLIIAPNHHLRTQLTHILHQVVSKRIVVVENKDHINLNSTLLLGPKARIALGICVSLFYGPVSHTFDSIDLSFDASSSWNVNPSDSCITKLLPLTYGAFA